METKAHKHTNNPIRQRTKIRIYNKISSSSSSSSGSSSGGDSSNSGGGGSSSSSSSKFHRGTLMNEYSPLHPQD
jgi:hypothetical protein